MRFLYILVGFLVGIGFTSSTGLKLINALETTYMEQVSTFTLVGYYEGWQRGRDYTEYKLLGLLYQCHKENRRP